MRRVITYLFLLVVVGVLALAAYAMLAELPPPIGEVIIDLPLPPANGR